MLTKISKLNLSYLTKSCRHTLSPNEKMLRQIYFFVAFCDNGDRQRVPCYVDCYKSGFCPEIKSVGTNGPLSLKKVGIYMTLKVYQYLEKLKRLRNCETIHNVCIQIRCFENNR